MKIALVSPYDTAHPGGVFEHIAHLRTEFVRHGHDVTVLAPRGRKGGLEVRDRFYGIGRTVPIPANGSTVRVTFDVTLYAAVKALLRQEQFDVIHLHEPLIPVLPYLVLLNSRSVNVATFHAFRASSPWYTAFKPILHGRLPITGFRFGDLAYITDAKEIPGASLELLRDLDILVLNALRARSHPTHLSFSEAIAIIQTVRPRRAYLVHLSHETSHADAERLLPAGIEIAWDGLVVASDDS